MTDAAIIYRTHVEAIECLPEAEQLKAYKAIVSYCMDDVVPEDMIGSYTVAMAKPLLDKWKAKREAGAKGGSTTKQTEATAKQTEADGSNCEPKEKEIVIVKDKEKEKDKKEREVRHRYGEYQHVLLSDKQYADLLDKYGDELLAAGIKRVDEYCEETGKGYKNYALVIQRWGVRASPTTKREDYFTAGQHENDGTAEAKAKVIEMAARGLL